MEKIKSKTKSNLMPKVNIGSTRIIKCTTNDLKRLTVVSKKEGRILGYISDVFISPKMKSLSNLLLKEAYWSTTYKSLKVKHIETVGEEIIVVDSANNCLPIKNLDTVSGINIDNIKGREIITRDGAYLGDLTEVNFSLNSWDIVDLIISSDRVLPVITKEILIGKDDILVPSSYANNLKEMSDRFIQNNSIHSEKVGLNKRLNNFKIIASKRAKDKLESIIH